MDTDVVVSAVDNAQKISAMEIWVPFGVGKNFSYISAHQIVYQLGSCSASALQMFHISTKCDTVSFFAGRRESGA